jgi:hypothetical protein
MKGGSIMSIRITSKQVEAAAKAREKALKDDPEYRLFEEEQQEMIQPAAEEKKNRKEKT